MIEENPITALFIVLLSLLYAFIIAYQEEKRKRAEQKEREEREKLLEQERQQYEYDKAIERANKLAYVMMKS